MSLYDKKVKEYNNILKVLSGSRKKEHQKEMAEYHNNTQTATSAMQSGRDAEGRTLATSGNTSNNVGAVEEFSTTRPATQSYKPQKPKSAFEQWNIEKTQPKLSYGAERLIQSANPSRNGWLDTTLRSYLSKPTNIDKPRLNGYNNGTEWDKSLYEYNPNHRHSERNEVKTKNLKIPRQAGHTDRSLRE